MKQAVPRSTLAPAKLAVAQCCYGEARGEELDGVADEPALHGRGVRFGVELNAQGLAVIGESLVRANRGRGQTDGADRQVESIAVPMEHGAFAEMPQRAVSSGIGQSDRGPADFFGAGRIDARTERTGDKLRAEANAENREPQGEPALDQRQLILEEGIGRFLISADWAAKDDERLRPVNGQSR